MIIEAYNISDYSDEWHKYPNIKPPYSEEEKDYLVCTKGFYASGGNDLGYVYQQAIYDGDVFVNPFTGFNIDDAVCAWKKLERYIPHDETKMECAE